MGGKNFQEDSFPGKCRTAVLKLFCTLKSPGKPVKAGLGSMPKILIQKVWDGAQEFSSSKFLDAADSAVQGPHFENHWRRVQTIE